MSAFNPDPSSRLTPDAIVADVIAKPKIQGIVAGRDEVLETAVHPIEDPK